MKIGAKKSLQILKRRIEKLLFIPALNPSDRSFDKNPIELINDTSGISCRTFSQNMSKYKDILVNIDPKKTAIIIIDLWNKKYLDKFANHKIIPLIELARRKNIVIVHAPSHNYKNIHHSIKVHPEDIVIKNYRDGNKELSSRNIDTLLYVGYDALSCVLDKPLGIFHTHLRNKNFKTILIRDGIMSKTYEMGQLATNIVETNFGCSVTIKDIYNYFKENPPQKIHYDVAFPKTSSFDLDNRKLAFKSSETAIVIVNFFDKSDNKEIEKNAKNKIIPLIEHARSNNIPTIYTIFSKNDSGTYKFQLNEYKISSEKEFVDILKKKQIKKLLYAGHFLNRGMLFGPAGISRLYIQKRYEFKNFLIPKLPDYYVISDASLAFETPETSPNQTFKKTLLKYYRDIKAITSENIIFQ